jgi:hypothetical protein
LLHFPLQPLPQCRIGVNCSGNAFFFLRGAQFQFARLRRFIARPAFGERV